VGFECSLFRVVIPKAPFDIISFHEKCRYPDTGASCIKVQTNVCKGLFMTAAPSPIVRTLTRLHPLFKTEMKLNAILGTRTLLSIVESFDCVWELCTQNMDYNKVFRFTWPCQLRPFKRSKRPCPIALHGFQFPL